jgi:hypothetical protein
MRTIWSLTAGLQSRRIRGSRTASSTSWTGLALALSREADFEWEEFREALIESICTRERQHAPDDPSWSHHYR